MFLCLVCRDGVLDCGGWLLWVFGGDGRLCWWCSTTRSARRWSGGLVVRGRRRRRLWVVGSCWRGLDGLTSDPRPGPPREITDGVIEDVLVRALETAPSGATHWSTRSMAKAAGVSQTAVSRIWRALGLKPRLVEDYKVSPDPQFVDKACDVVGLYLNPPEAAPVLCVDEKTGIGALDRTAPILLLTPGAAQRRSHDYRRCGATDLLTALDAASSKAFTAMTARQRSEELPKFLNLIDTQAPDELDVHIVLGNVFTNKTAAVKRWLVRHPRFKLHFTPTYSSWMNHLERWFSELTTKWLKSGAHRSVTEPKDSINQWTNNKNQNPRPFTWHKTADQIPDTTAAYMQQIPHSGH